MKVNFLESNEVFEDVVNSKYLLLANSDYFYHVIGLFLIGRHFKDQGLSLAGIQQMCLDFSLKCFYYVL